MWNGHSCPLPLTLILPLILNQPGKLLRQIHFKIVILSGEIGEANDSRSRRTPCVLALPQAS